MSAGTTPSTSTAVPRPRLVWMDTIRGAAILLVLLWHAPAVPALFGADVPPAVAAANFFFLPFRMPTLMVLSGMLLAAALRKPLVRYYVGKVQLVVWPYLVWVLVDRLVLGADHPWFHWRSYYATSYLWFLFFIAVFYAVAPLLHRVPTPLVIAACAAANLVLPSGTEDRMAYFAVFFFLGHLVGQHPGWLDRATRGRHVWLLAAAGVAVGVLSAVTLREYAYQVVLAPFSVAGIAACIAAFRWLDERGRSPRPLAAIGKNSIIYYVSHFPVMVGVWLGGVALGVDHLLAVSSVGLVAALTVGAVLARGRSTAPVSWLFESPRTPTRWVEARLDRLVGARVRTGAGRGAPG